MFANLQKQLKKHTFCKNPYLHYQIPYTFLISTCETENLCF
jgi:hypothetical protein